MAYVDGFLLSIPKRKIGVYRQIARKAGKIWMKYGALEYRECVGDDYRAAGMVPFPKRAKAKSGEAVVFSWIVYKSRAHRDRVNKKVMSDPSMLKMMQPDAMPFNPKNMTYGGFKVLVDL